MATLIRRIPERPWPLPRVQSRLCSTAATGYGPASRADRGPSKAVRVLPVQDSPCTTISVGAASSATAARRWDSTPRCAGVAHGRAARNRRRSGRQKAWGWLGALHAAVVELFLQPLLVGLSPLLPALPAAPPLFRRDLRGDQCRLPAVGVGAGDLVAEALPAGRDVTVLPLPVSALAAVRAAGTNSVRARSSSSVHLS